MAEVLPVLPAKGEWYGEVLRGCDAAMEDRRGPPLFMMVDVHAT